ncbi:MAG: glycoside hydrolase family 65 protein, partial [Deltaproteobacteria bacterium]|nr:glycoside hydrolase family 65 protein [Deltaproteobacteria bacterium]
MKNQWIIEQSDFDSVENIKRYESLFTLGNGYLGLRGDLIFSGKAIQKGTYINGFYEKGLITYGEKAFGFAENWQTMIPLPEGKEVNISINGKKLFNNRGKFLENKRILDLKESKSVWEFIWKDESNLVYKGNVTTLVPFSFKGTAIFIWDLILPEDEQSISFDSFLSFENTGDSLSKDPRLPAHFNGSTITLEKKVTNQDIKLLNILATGSSLTLSCTMDHLTGGIDIKEQRIDELENGYCTKLSGKAGRAIQFTKVLSYSYNSSKHIERTEKTVINEQKMVKINGIDKILEEQRSFMEKYWQYGDIEIKGNKEAQISLRFNLFQMLQSTGTDGKRTIAAKGLSGPGYEGHYFWDAETYVLPYFIYTNPSIARSMLEYRISIVDGAKERAKLLGHDGVLFPWRTINGEESSAYFPAGTAQ